jgi:hypothetical protein
MLDLDPLRAPAAVRAETAASLKIGTAFGIERATAIESSPIIG